MASTIPGFYRVFFATIDPLIATSGALITLFTPTTYLRSYFPTPTSPPHAETILCLDTLSGFFASTVLLQIFLLRAKPADLTVWRLLEASILIQDIASVAAFARVAVKQHRLSYTNWTFYEWSNLVIISAVAMIRIAFLAGIGMKSNLRSKDK